MVVVGSPGRGTVEGRLGVNITYYTLRGNREGGGTTERSEPHRHTISSNQHYYYRRSRLAHMLSSPPTNKNNM